MFFFKQKGKESSLKSLYVVGKFDLTFNRPTLDTIQEL